MTLAQPLLAATVIFAGGLAGAWLLRRAWRERTDKARWRASGWAVIAATLIWPAWLVDGARGLFFAATLIPLSALVLIASGYTLRPARTARKARDGLAPEPAERTPSLWRTILRWSLAGPVGMIAAMAVGISYAVWAPGEAQTRLLIGGLIVPVAWGGAMAWTLADSRILRATAVLIGTALVGFGAAMLRGFA